MSVTTLTTVLGTIELPGDMLWTNEFGWTPVAIASSVTLGGALLREVSVQLAGRPITLEGAADGPWVDWDTMEALRLAEIAQAATDAPMTLTLSDGRTYLVLFLGGGDAPACSGQQVVPRAPVDAAARAKLQHIPTIRLIEVPA